MTSPPTKTYTASFQAPCASRSGEHTRRRRGEKAASKGSPHSSSKSPRDTSKGGSFVGEECCQEGEEGRKEDATKTAKNGARRWLECRAVPSKFPSTDRISAHSSVNGHGSVGHSVVRFRRSPLEEREERDESPSVCVPTCVGPAFYGRANVCTVSHARVRVDQCACATRASARGRCPMGS